MNKSLLVSDANNFSVEFEINPYMHKVDQPDWDLAEVEHEAIVAAHVDAGRTIEYVPTVSGCPDMIYTANAALVRGGQALIANLPPERDPELPHFRRWFLEHGYDVIDAPYRFSGQGDALAFGSRLFAGSGWRTDVAMHPMIADALDYDVISLHTISDRWYDLDLAIAVITPETIAWCPRAFDLRSRRTIRELPGVELIEVGLDEAELFALNLVSDTVTVTMTTGAPRLAQTLRDRGYRVVELPTEQLKKGGGGIRCTALALDN
jgi:N-dimethylarginine dimethylaminohydrolase